MKKILIPMLIICVLFGIVSCGSDLEDNGGTFTEANDVETTGAINESETKDMNEIEIVPLTAEELETYNKTFEYLLYDEQGHPVPGNKPINQFLTSYYNKPQDINLAKLLKNFPSDGDVTDETEFEALKTSEHFPFVNGETLDSMPVPIHKFSADTVNIALENYMGITLDDLSGAGTENLVYLKAYNAYYNYTSDCSGAYFECVSGEKQGDIVRLYGKNATLTLKLRDDGFRFISHQLSEKDSGKNGGEDSTPLSN